MQCSQFGRCICAENWRDENGLEDDGCEEFVFGLDVDHLQCQTIQDVDENSQLEGTFNADDLNILYLTGPDGYDFQIKFHFEWKFLNNLSEETNRNTLCKLGDFSKPALRILSLKREEEEVMTVVQKFGEAFRGFEAQFEEEFSRYCKTDARKVPCRMFEFGEEETSSQEIVATLAALVSHVVGHCVAGFGHRWTDELDKLGTMVGGPFPQIIIPSTIGRKCELCSACDSDADCGDFSTQWLRCSENNFCVCADSWTGFHFLY